MGLTFVQRVVELLSVARGPQTATRLLRSFPQAKETNKALTKTSRLSGISDLSSGLRNIKTK